MHSATVNVPVRVRLYSPHLSFQYLSGWPSIVHVKVELDVEGL